MIKLVSKGSWKKTRGWLNKAKQQKSYLNSLRKYGQRGVNALRDSYITKDPDDPVVMELTMLPKCRHTNHYAKDNLHHDAYTIFY